MISLEAMTIKQWISRARYCEREIAVLQKAKERERERITSLTASPDSVVVSGTADPHKFDEYAELSGALDRRIHELYRVKHEALEVIQKVQDDKLRELLLLRYISVMTWEEIAASMGLSYRHVCRLHGDALSQAKKYLPMS